MLCILIEAFFLVLITCIFGSYGGFSKSWIYYLIYGVLNLLDFTKYPKKRNKAKIKIDIYIEHRLVPVDLTTHHSIQQQPSQSFF